MGELLTPAEVARILGVTPTRVRQLADARLLVVEMTPLGRLITLDSVLELKRRRETGEVKTRAKRALPLAAMTAML